MMGGVKAIGEAMEGANVEDLGIDREAKMEGIKIVGGVADWNGGIRSCMEGEVE